MHERVVLHSLISKSYRWASSNGTPIVIAEIADLQAHICTMTHCEPLFCAISSVNESHYGHTQYVHSGHYSVHYVHYGHTQHATS